MRVRQNRAVTVIALGARFDDPLTERDSVRNRQGLDPVARLSCKSPATVLLCHLYPFYERFLRGRVEVPTGGDRGSREAKSHGNRRQPVTRAEEAGRRTLPPVGTVDPVRFRSRQ